MATTRDGSIRDKAAKLTKELKFKVSTQAVQSWEEAGYDLDDTPGLIRNILNQRTVPQGLVKALEAGELEMPPELEEKPLDQQNSVELRASLLRAQILKTRAEARTREVRADLEERNSIPAEEARESAMRLAALEKSHWLQLENILPPMLDGLSKPEMKKKIGQHARKILGELHRLGEDIGK